MKTIYLDNAATTRVLQTAADAMLEYARGKYYNPSAGYRAALEVRHDIADAAGVIASVIGADPHEIVFTSCATESNNHVFSCGVKNKKGNVVISAVEHASVYESAMRLKSKGADVRIVDPDPNGRVTAEKVAAAVDENTAFVSVIHCSNETGVINDIAVISSAVKAIAPKAVIHSDGVQAFCKIPVNVKALGVDLYSMSAHKVGGMKGTGALYIRNGFNMQPFIAGGGQQDGRRSGTENVCGIMSFAAAAAAYRNAARSFDANALRNIFVERFGSGELSRINGGSPNSGYIVSISFRGLKGEIIAHEMDDRGIMIGLGSACSTHIRSNRVLGSMGVPKEFAEGSVRISFSPRTTEDDARTAADALDEITKDLRQRTGR